MLTMEITMNHDVIPIVPRSGGGLCIHTDDATHVLGAIENLDKFEHFEKVEKIENFEQVENFATMLHHCSMHLCSIIAVLRKH